jgi:hypothetical protein
MKKFILIAIVGAISAVALGADVNVEALDYARIKRLIPEGWIIKSASVVDSPTGWRRTKGSKGIQVSFENPAVMIHEKMVGDYHPHYSFTLVPLDWEGVSMLGNTFVEGKVGGKPDLDSMVKQAYPDDFKKTYSSFRYFGSYLGRGDWKDPFKDLSPHFDNMK